ncbi:receptor like protein 7 [Brachypodium distachyon]|uniref:receptor like protein 7 n=1 Tax=Brachypodium distachyon TaxID=15368 RepID=UPI000234E353|nr:receptor like protein 7 [Brachypodium distachyon]|eukprot:XP_003567505.1 receptor like protein 7 [Brachypodium distachyon]
MACATHLPAIFVLIQLYLLAASASRAPGNATASSLCHPDQAAALLQLKESFIFDYSTTTLSSWQPGTDCCHWEGVGCDDGISGGGHVTVLDLGGCGLYSYGCHAALFNLASLCYLDLSMNDFGRSRIPAVGFGRLTNLTHLNLSQSSFYGQVPSTIGNLTSLISLDLSSLNDIDPFETNNMNDILYGGNDLELREPSFETLFANLTNLRELYLDGVDISSSREEWCSGLGKSVPRLQVLSMGGCNLWGPIHSSLSSLRSLTVINLNSNSNISGVIPEFLSEFHNLSVLQLKYNHFSGSFPLKIFLLKNIRVIDVSHNDQLSGHLPEFKNGTSLETLNLYYTNFSSIKLGSFRNLMKLRRLGIDVDGRSISTMEPTDLLFNKLNSLQSLLLSFVKFSGEFGPFFSWISNLQNLTSLQLTDYYSSKIMPPLIGNLTNLTSLEITRCGFSGEIPPSIGNLSKLISLRISSCHFSGRIPSSIGNLKKLRSLDITSNRLLGGPITRDIGQLSKLMVLKLGGCGFSGTIPSTIVNLTQLIYVGLGHNDLTGEIPTSLFTSPIMLLLDLSSNQLSGPIQEFDTLNSHMSAVYLHENQITGQIPSSFFQLTSLVAMDLSSNNLTGLIQLSSPWKLRKLGYLALSNNRLSILDEEDSKPTEPLLPNLFRLELASCNMTRIPRFLMQVNHIRTLDLSRNKIQGAIPQWIWETWDDSIIILDLSNNIFTNMPLSSNMLPSRLEYLDISFNELEGQIPTPNLLTAFSSFFQVLDYSNNKFSSFMSNFTAYLSQTAYLTLSRNNISGHIPNSICDSRKLVVLDLSFNKFSGIIPSCLIEDSHLHVLNLRENHFEGTLPYNVAEHCNLQTIDLHGNKIQGQLPRSFSNCANLEILDIGNNQIVDTFPSWLGRLSHLCVLVLGSNLFYGPLAYPSRDSKFGDYFSRLQIIDISSNNFSGNLDPRWFERLTFMMANSNDTGNILGHPNFDRTPYYYDIIAITYKGQDVTFEKVRTALTVIDFSNNSFHGDIPESTGRLVSLHVLNMSHNAFTGRIPTKMGEMRQLESLDLSWNELSGEIPQELTNLTFLSTLKFCENKLYGRIPQSGQFATFENTSYERNTGLCGPPLSKPCGDSSNPNEAQVSISEDHADIVLFLFIGVGFGVGFTAGILMKWGKIGKWFRIVRT